VIEVIDTCLPVYSLRNSCRHSVAGAAFIVALLVSLPAQAVDHLTLKFASIKDTLWQAESVTAALTLSSSVDQFKVDIGVLKIPQQALEITQLTLNCLEGRVSDSIVKCANGQSSFIINGQKLSNVHFGFTWDKAQNRLDIKTSGLRYAGLRFSINGSWDKGSWKANIATRPINLASTSTQSSFPLSLLSPYISAGTARIRADLKGVWGNLKMASWTLAFNKLTFSDSSEEYVGEDLAGQWRGGIRRMKAGGWRGSHKLYMDKGAILSPAVYLEPETNRIDLKSDFSLNQPLTRLNLSRIQFGQKRLLEVQGDASVDVTKLQLRSIKIKTNPFKIQDVFTNNLQPVLSDPALEALELSGTASISGEYSATGDSQFRLTLDDVNLEQGLTGAEAVSSNLAIYGLSSQLFWDSSGPANQSHVKWKAAELLGGIPIGPTEIRLQLEEKNLLLSEPVHIPVFDGSLVIDELKLSKGVEASEDQFHFKGYLNPISMEQFSQAAGWPILSGQLSGMIPRVHYREGFLKIEGITLIRLFGGSILLKDLQLEDLFGPLPALTARLELKDIDLEALTQTFSFGKITGKLEGQINDLRLENWVPVSFDAWFATPKDDETRHRISQKAVDNLSNLGGAGVSGALSRSFMRFFEEFSYSRLGLKCKLEGNICWMGGIEEAEQGYYLVKGGGIPRIDIMGFNQRTDWQQLLNKLERITTGGAVVIE